MPQQLNILQNSQEIPVPESLHISLIRKAWVDLINAEAATGVVLSKKGVLKNLAISQENTCVGAWNYKESLFNKVAANQACNFTKIRLQHRCFPVKFMKFLRTPTLKNICQQMLLQTKGSKKLTLCPVRKVNPI